MTKRLSCKILQAVSPFPKHANALRSFPFRHLHMPQISPGLLYPMTQVAEPLAQLPGPIEESFVALRPTQN